MLRGRGAATVSRHDGSHGAGGGRGGAAFSTFSDPAAGGADDDEVSRHVASASTSSSSAASGSSASSAHTTGSFGVYTTTPSWSHREHVHGRCLVTILFEGGEPAFDFAARVADHMSTGPLRVRLSPPLVPPPTATPCAPPVLHERVSIAQLPVGDLLLKRFGVRAQFCTEDEPVASVFSHFHHVTRLPVLDHNNCPVGILSDMDVLDFLQVTVPEEHRMAAEGPAASSSSSVTPHLSRYAPSRLSEKMQLAE